MIVGIDAHMIGERETGNERYTLNLIRGLSALSANGLEYRLMTPRPAELTRRLELDDRFRVTRVRPTTSALRIPVGMPLAVRANGIDVLHVSYIAPPFALCPTVVTVHDLSYLAHPEWVSSRVRILLSSLVPRSLRRAARVIAISEFTRQDLIARYRVPDEKIAVIGEAPAEEFGPLADASLQPLPAGVQEPFLLAVGNLEPRKNLLRLFEAFGRLVREHRFPGQLVIAGKHKYRGEQIAAEASGLRDRVCFTGFIDDATLNLLYNRAALFVYPSLYEGFGLPPIEAMRCGCPVVASNATAIPQTLGDAALLVDPQSIDELANAMAAILGDRALARTLAARGRAHASRFSWRETAALTAQVYAAAVGDSRASPVPRA